MDFYTDASGNYEFRGWLNNECFLGQWTAEKLPPLCMSAKEIFLLLLQLPFRVRN